MSKPYHSIAFVAMKSTRKERRFSLNTLAPTKQIARDRAGLQDGEPWRWLYNRGWRIVKVKITETKTAEMPAERWSGRHQ